MGAFCAVFFGTVTSSLSADGADDLSAGPLFSVFQLTLAEGSRTEALGPFFYQQEVGSQTGWAVPPIFSSFTDPSLESVERDFLYPVCTYDRFGSEYRWQFLQWLSFAGGKSQDESDQERFTLFPFYWQQRSTDPAKNYTALWPVHGHLKHRLLRDEITFTMWPLYVRTVKHRGNIDTRNFVAPFFHYRTGDGLKGWQAWPLIGSETKVVTSRTNMWDEIELVPGHSQQFVLWPFWLSETRGIGTTNQADLRAWLPFYMQLRSPARDSTTYLWPFGLTLTEHRAKQYHETSFLWPMFAFARGEGKTVNRFWPVYGTARTPAQEKNFLLWPLYIHTESHSPTLERERSRVLFFLYSDLKEERLSTQQSRRRVDLWPLFTHSRDLAGNTRLQILAPLEPLLADNKGVQRNWSPLWSIWRAENNPATGASSQSLLWNLYRRDKTPEGTKTSCLLGLYQRERNDAGAGLRLLFIPLKRAPVSATPPIAPDDSLTHSPAATQPR